MGKIPGQREPFYKRGWFIELISLGPPALAGIYSILSRYFEFTKNANANPTSFGISVASGSLPIGFTTVFPIFIKSIEFLPIIAFIWLLVAYGFKIYSVYAKENENRSNEIEPLRSCVISLFWTILKQFQIDPTPGILRITIHWVVPSNIPGKDPEELEQILPYVGGSDSSGRRFSIRSGIIGLVARKKTAYATKRTSQNIEDYQKELVEQWCFTETDARLIKTDRFSWMAL